MLGSHSWAWWMAWCRASACWRTHGSWPPTSPRAPSRACSPSTGARATRGLDRRSTSGGSDRNGHLCLVVLWQRDCQATWVHCDKRRQALQDVSPTTRAGGWAFLCARHGSLQRTSLKISERIYTTFLTIGLLEKTCGSKRPAAFTQSSGS